MLDHARSGGTSAARCLGATAAMLALTPAAAAAQAPVAPAAPLIALVDGIAPPTLPAAAPAGAPVASLARACPGARSRSGARRRAAAVRCLVNHARARSGLRGFRASATLARAARRHARDMVRRRYFAHQRGGGPSLTRRARAAGWRGAALGEAIAYGCGGTSTPVSIVRMWLASPPHAAILLSHDLGKAGIAVAGRAPVSCGGGATYVLDAGRS
jgi:uncharacterized protein YkwD